MIFQLLDRVIPVSVPDTVIVCFVVFVCLWSTEVELPSSALNIGSEPSESNPDPESDSDLVSVCNLGSCKLDSGKILGLAPEPKIINKF